MGERKVPDRRETPFSNMEDTDWGRLQQSRHEENGKRFEAIEKELNSVKSDTKESVELLRSIKLGGSFLKWFVGISAGIAGIFGVIWTVVVYGHKP